MSPVKSQVGQLGASTVAPLGPYPPIWVLRHDWANGITVVGEEHSTDYATTQFVYGVSSGNSLSVQLSVGGGPWSASGSVTVTNTQGVDTVWPVLPNPTYWYWGYQMTSGFHYQEWGLLSGGIFIENEVYAVGYNGGATIGSTVSGDEACPSSVRSGSYGLWAQYIQGSQRITHQDNGVAYSVGTTLTGAVGGATGSVTISSTTTYEHHTTVATWLNGPYTYYAYSRSSSNWPNVYWTNSAVGCGGCVAKDTPILTDHGYVPVQALRIGDTTTSYDAATKSLIRTHLTSLTVTHESGLININSGALVVTANDQPIYLARGGFAGWLRDPKDLRVGDLIFDPVRNVWIPITTLSFSLGKAEVYDVVTDGPNNFIANGILLDRKCVAQGTSILTPHGYVSVQNLRPGETLMSFDITNQSLVESHLVRLTMTVESELVRINDGALVVTANDQPIFIANRTFTGWLMNPRDLVVGDLVYDPVHSAWIPIIHLSFVIESLPVYDVVTDGPNNFIANGMLL
jgi:hypothetical protein